MKSLEQRINNKKTLIKELKKKLMEEVEEMYLTDDDFQDETKTSIIVESIKRKEMREKRRKSKKNKSKVSNLNLYKNTTKDFWKDAGLSDVNNPMMDGAVITDLGSINGGVGGLAGESFGGIEEGEDSLEERARKRIKVRQQRLDNKVEDVVGIKKGFEKFDSFGDKMEDKESPLKHRVKAKNRAIRTNERLNKLRANRKKRILS